MGVNSQSGFVEVLFGVFRGLQLRVVVNEKKP